MGKVVLNYLPAGYSDSDDDYYDEIEEYYNGKPRNHYKPAEVEKPQIEIFKAALLDHVNNGNTDKLRSELDSGSIKGFDIDLDVSNGWNLLFHSCFIGRSAVVEFLIKERGANTNLYIDNESPLMITCKSMAMSDEVLKIVKLLVKESTNINSTNSYGITPLMMACDKGHIETVEFLMNRGASITTIDNNGYNALFYAIESNRVEIAKLLIEAGIDLSVVDKQGNTAKMIADGDNRDEILKLFPPEKYQYKIPTSFLSYSDFKSLVPNTLGHNDVPPYFPDVMSMLRGMDCVSLAPKFAIAEISLTEFLTISDEKLSEIGIEMPFQRDTIRLGLFNFFNAKWSKKSLNVPAYLKTHVSSLDLIYTLANLLRHLVSMKCQLQYYRELNFNLDPANAERFLTLEHLHNFQGQIKSLRGTMEKIKPTVRPLLIEKATKKKFSKKVVISFVAFSSFALYFFYRK